MLKLLSRALLAVNLVMAQEAEESEKVQRTAEELLDIALATEGDLLVKGQALEELAKLMGGDTIGAIMAAADAEKARAAGKEEQPVEEEEKYKEELKDSKKDMVKENESMKEELDRIVVKMSTLQGQNLNLQNAIQKEKKG